MIAGDGGNGRWWTGKCPVVERAADLLMALDELGEENIDWAGLLTGLPHLQCLTEMSFPPLSDMLDFEHYLDVFVTLPI